jgi:hypothetical protein
MQTITIKKTMVQEETSCSRHDDASRADVKPTLVMCPISPIAPRMRAASALTHERYARRQSTLLHYNHVVHVVAREYNPGTFFTTPGFCDVRTRGLGTPAGFGTAVKVTHGFRPLKICDSHSIHKKSLTFTLHYKIRHIQTLVEPQSTRP